MALVFKATWTPAGGAAVTLADVTQKWTMKVEQLGGQAIEQVEPLFMAANPARIPRGNVAGDCVFSSSQSFATRAAAVTFFESQYNLMNGQGSLVFYVDAVSLVMQNAVFRAVAMVEMNGLRWTLRYTFGITTMAMGGGSPSGGGGGGSTVTADSASATADSTTITADS